MRTIIESPGAPKAIGPYSQGIKIKANELIYLSGQIPLDPVSGHVVEGGVEAQAERVLENITALLTAAGAKMTDVVKATMFLKDMNDFPKVNAIYSRYFPTNPPARSTIEVARLPRDVLVEIEVIAAL
ncbi:RidA family protein [Telmatocola sphagniphila]|uniref:RidA family protein n=1 Tax=Telmatocola sphagniphila TaxID=1123043 RepID=A0A8E6B6D3_9BACT|nr:RidA family protein [Telmatocola sphagniphila]QVL32925.1 RidA family protein [Telmatocola sphagniphila]